MQNLEFHVPHRFKIAFVWLSIAVTLLLVSTQFNKRANYWGLHVNNVMQPIVIPAKFDLNVKMETVFPGRTPDLDAMDSRAVLYHFWATWCSPCRAEIPTLNDLQKRFGDTLKVVTIAADENKEDVLRFFAGTSPQFQVLWDKAQTTSEKWGVQKYPESFLYLPHQKQMLKFSGPRDWNSPEATDYFSQVLPDIPI